MAEYVSLVPLLAILVSATATLPILISRRPNVREGWTFAAAGIKFALVLSLLPAVLGGREPAWSIASILPQMAIKLRVDPFGLFFALVASGLWIVTSAYSIGYMRGLKEHSQTRYYCFFALSLAATIGVAFAANFLTLYLFYEMLSFATYPLVTHHQDQKARTSGRKYLAFIVGASIGLLLPAMIIIYQLSGTLMFKPGGFLPPTIGTATTCILLFMCLFGFAKAAVMPLHSWLPAAMVAPTPVSALLHAVAVVKVGVFCILRVVYFVFGPEFLSRLPFGSWVAYIAAFTVIAASIVALTQDELKARLAYSTIGQLSYIVLGAGLLTGTGLTGSMMHIAMHAFGKITLFFCAGAIFVTAGIKHISKMDGLGRRMPVTMFCFFCGSLSVIGIPPFGGFASKWYLITGTLEAGQGTLLAVLLISSLLNAAYFLPIVYRAFFATPVGAAGVAGMQEASPWCLIPIVLTALGSLVLFFFPQPFLALAHMTVAALF